MMNCLVNGPMSECAMERWKSQLGRPTWPLLNALLPSNMISSSLHYDRDDRGIVGSWDDHPMIRMINMISSSPHHDLGDTFPAPPSSMVIIYGNWEEFCFCMKSVKKKYHSFVRWAQSKVHNSKSLLKMYIDVRFNYHQKVSNCC